MLVINTIQEFYSLSEIHQNKILRALKTRDRLDKWLDSLNNRHRNGNGAARYIPCPTCRHYDKPGHLYITPRDNSDIHPSQIHKCLKKLWFDCSNVEVEELVEGHRVKVKKPWLEFAEENIPPRLRKIFDIGHGWHDYIQQYGARGAWGPGKHYHAEVPINPDLKDEYGRPLNPKAAEYWIKGSVDAVIDPYVVSVEGIGDVAIRVVHEYKTINANGFKGLKKPKAEHKWQATIYSAMLDIPVVVFLYTNKNDCTDLDFPIPFDRMIWAKIEEKIDKVQEYVDEEIVPPWAETSAALKPYECKECPYLRVCNPENR